MKLLINSRLCMKIKPFHIFSSWSNLFYSLYFGTFIGRLREDFALNLSKWRHMKCTFWLYEAHAACFGCKKHMNHVVCWHEAHETRRVLAWGTWITSCAGMNHMKHVMCWHEAHETRFVLARNTGTGLMLSRSTKTHFVLARSSGIVSRGYMNSVAI